jgi:hypothetical protein
MASRAVIVSEIFSVSSCTRGILPLISVELDIGFATIKLCSSTAVMRWSFEDEGGGELEGPTRAMTLFGYCLVGSKRVEVT